MLANRNEGSRPSDGWLVTKAGRSYCIYCLHSAPFTFQQTQVINGVPQTQKVKRNKFVIGCSPNINHIKNHCKANDHKNNIRQLAADIRNHSTLFELRDHCIKCRSCAESKTLQQAVTENPAFSALSDYQLKLRFTDYLPPHNCSLKSQTTANPQPIRTSHTPSQINTSSQPVSINPPIADDNLRLDIISTQFQSNETTSLTPNTNPAWTIADLFSSNLQNENIQSMVPMGQNFQTLHYNDEVHGGFEFGHDVNLKTHDTNSKRRLSDSSIGARKRLNENHYIDLTEGSNSIPLKVCLGRFRSSGGWAVIKLDSIYRKIINGKPLKRKITWINPSSFHFTWNDEKDYRIWIYDVSNKGYYQIGHSLKIWQILSTIENDGWNFFRKVDNSLDQVLHELKLSEYINILFEQGFTTENVVNLPQHYDKLEIKLAHRNTFDDYISRLKLTSGAKNPLQ
ncbi:hypothetical protein HDV02_001754 [Globomyces sp. JEL0801]|nr:hypothetical protein HDV02_001754 [Globomyces sp. JEL0801]